MFARHRPPNPNRFAVSDSHTLVDLSLVWKVGGKGSRRAFIRQ